MNRPQIVPTSSRRVLIAPDKFRGTASAGQVGEALAIGARQAHWDVDLCPLSDGGEGFLACFGGPNRQHSVSGPLGRRVLVGWRRENDTAIVESALACGLGLISSPSPEKSLACDSTGVGELIAAALDDGATTVIVGIGGLCSTDGGRGALSALASYIPFASEVTIVAAADVGVPFLDAASVFSPQKGADDSAVHQLTRRLIDFAPDLFGIMGRDVLTSPNSGAGGGLAGGLWAAGAHVSSGFSLVATRLALRARMDRADLVLSGEGRLDATSLEGKVTGEVMKMARDAATPLSLVAGDVRLSIGPDYGRVATWNLGELFGAGTSFNDVGTCLRDAAFRICSEFEA